MNEPLQPPGTGTTVLFGNLCPNGAVIKQSAASAPLMKHRGNALVFDWPEAYHAVGDEDEFDVEPSDILVIRNCGPKGYPGMPEVSNVALPAKLLRQDVSDMVRICDGRMSGTGFGTVLHVAPEASLGPLAVVQSGDVIELDVPTRWLHLDISDEELTSRCAAWSPPEGSAESGYEWLYVTHLLQADLGVDF
jgi:dihydroxyacid dehydratase/phosphogluconate dehydratase